MSIYKHFIFTLLIGLMTTFAYAKETDTYLVANFQYDENAIAALPTAAQLQYMRFNTAVSEELDIRLHPEEVYTQFLEHITGKAIEYTDLSELKAMCDRDGTTSVTWEESVLADIPNGGEERLLRITYTFDRDTLTISHDVTRDEENIARYSDAYLNFPVSFEEEFEQNQRDPLTIVWYIRTENTGN